MFSERELKIIAFLQATMHIDYIGSSVRINVARRLDIDYDILCMLVHIAVNLKEYLNRPFEEERNNS